MLNVLLTASHPTLAPRSHLLLYYLFSVCLSIQGGFYMNNKGRYHNDYSPRYQDAFDIYEKAKNHAKEQRKKERLHSLSIVEQEHRNRSGDDNTISNKTPHVRNLSKKQKSKDGGEDNL